MAYRQDLLLLLLLSNRARLPLLFIPVLRLLCAASIHVSVIPDTVRRSLRALPSMHTRLRGTAILRTGMAAVDSECGKSGNLVSIRE
ncbi:MAG: hypothetical protein J6R92_07040 [Akkermansia sp.]|nr:hypothetical protein [Akkermansia sp.]